MARLLLLLLLLLLLCSTIACVVSYQCGETMVGYPLWVDGEDGATTSYFGYPELRVQCRRDTPVLALPSGDYPVTGIEYGENRTISLFDQGIFSNSSTSCPDHVAGRNLTLPPDGPLSLTSSDTNLAFFIGCTFAGISDSYRVACLDGDGGRLQSYVFYEDDDDHMPPYDLAGMCQDVVRIPVLRRSVLGSGTGTGPLDAVVHALKVGFELTWRPAAGGECGACESTGGLCGQRRAAASDAWAFTCFRATGAN
jgi:hypothetical protein